MQRGECALCHLFILLDWLAGFVSAAPAASEAKNRGKKCLPSDMRRQALPTQFSLGRDRMAFREGGFQVAHISYELLPVEPLGRLPGFDPVRAEQPVGLVTICVPELPGHGDVLAPGDAGESASVIGNDRNRVATPGTGRSLTVGSARRNCPHRLL